MKTTATKTAAQQEQATDGVAVGRTSLLQRKCACGGAAGLTGKCEECESKDRYGVVPLLPQPFVGAADERYEREADRIANKVLAASAPAPARIERLVAQAGNAGATPPSVQEVLAGEGRSLEAPLRQDMEKHFGHDFSSVRVHVGAAAERSAQDLNARAYTAGSNMVFGTGQFAPQTRQGRWLVAHELTHVVQQAQADQIPASTNYRGDGPTPVHTREAPFVVQRQASSSPVPISSSAGTTSPAPEETAHAPSVRIRIVGHASPRWRGARGAAEADRRNFELSRRRADAVRSVVEELLAARLGTHVSVNVGVTVEDQDEGTVGAESVVRGSRDTLQEAKGDPSDNDPDRRRVDVIIESGQLISGSVGASREMVTGLPTATESWKVDVDFTISGSVDVAGAILILKLTNMFTNQTMEGQVRALGRGVRLSAGFAKSIWGSPAFFVTDRPVDFQHFQGCWVRYTTLGAAALLGAEQAYLTFHGFGSGAASINVSGWSVGFQGGGGGMFVFGKLKLNTRYGYPPTTVPWKRPIEDVTPYERTEHGKELHKVQFSTGSARVEELQVDILDSFLASIVAATRRQ